MTVFITNLCDQIMNGTLNAIFCSLKPQNTLQKELLTMSFIVSHAIFATEIIILYYLRKNFTEFKSNL